MVLLFEPIIGGENNKGNDNIFRLGDVGFVLNYFKKKIEKTDKSDDNE